MGLHGTAVGANNNLINRRVDENFGLGDDWAFSTLTVSANEITITSRTHLVDTSGGAQQVDTIAGGVKGQELIIHASSAANGLTITHNATPSTDEVCIVDGTDFVSNDVYDFVRLHYNGTYWVGTKHNL